MTWPMSASPPSTGTFVRRRIFPPYSTNCRQRTTSRQRRRVDSPLRWRKRTPQRPMQDTTITAADDARYMALAFTLGQRGLGRTWPNPSVGAVVVRDDGMGPVVVGRGWTQAGGRPHAEPQALARAGDAARGATLYVTLEPCSHHGRTPPCADAIVAAGIARVVSAMVDPNPQVAGAGHWRMAEAGVVVEVGVGAEEARIAHAGHLRL